MNTFPDSNAMKFGGSQPDSVADTHCLGLAPAAALGWAIVGILPFWSLYLAHLLLGPNLPTGFIVADMPYYCANGREIFERGNGLFYCNPYDTNPDAPVIYLHWLPWIFGFCISVLGLDPGLVFVVVGAAAGLGCSLLTYRIVEHLLPTPRFRTSCFLFTMWGGGVCVLAAAAGNLISGTTIGHDLLRFDPFQGWWFLSWGRNLTMPQEAVYHCCAAAAWLAVLNNRPWPAVLAVSLLAATHPWSGIQQLAILGGWLTLTSWRSAAARLPLAATAAVSAVFLWYYFVYLPSFPAHKQIHGTWSLDWTLPWPSLLAAYLPIALLALGQLGRQRWQLTPANRFLLLAAAVSLLLVKHELFLPARQPLHFTRGYVWLPLCLISLPLIQALGGWLLKLQQPLQAAAAAGLIGLAVADNAAFIGLFWNQPFNQHTDVRIDPAVAEVFAILEQRNETGIALLVQPNPNDWEDYNYLLATYTKLSPFLGHPWLTPDFKARQKAATDFLDRGIATGPATTIDTLVLPRNRQFRLPGGRAAWQQIYAGRQLSILKRASVRPATTTPLTDREKSRLLPLPTQSDR